MQHRAARNQKARRQLGRSVGSARMSPAIIGFAAIKAWALCQCHHLATAHDNHGMCIMDRKTCHCTGLRLWKLGEPNPELPFGKQPHGN